VVSESLVVNEVYLSLQGESAFAGWPCILIRLTGCNLRCAYCDTAYAFTEGRPWTLPQLHAEVRRLAVSYPVAADGTRLPLVELTGGEPLLQPAAFKLVQELADAGFKVLLETNGAVDIASVDKRVHVIMDLKCPSSGEVERNLWQNLPFLKPTDEIKFVVWSREDYEWVKNTVRERRLAEVCGLLLSRASPLAPGQQAAGLKRGPGEQHLISHSELAERMLADALPARLQFQLHKLIWPPHQRGV
jgi:7-carboxy-7-deazaguanine synthase